MVPLVEVPGAHFPRRELALREEAHTHKQHISLLFFYPRTEKTCSLEYVFPRRELALREEAYVSEGAERGEAKAGEGM